MEVGTALCRSAFPAGAFAPCSPTVVTRSIFHSMTSRLVCRRETLVCPSDVNDQALHLPTRTSNQSRPLPAFLLWIQGLGNSPCTVLSLAVTLEKDAGPRRKLGGGGPVGSTLTGQHPYSGMASRARGCWLPSPNGSGTSRSLRMLGGSCLEC